MKRFWWIISGVASLGILVVIGLAIAPKPLLSPSLLSTIDYAVWGSHAPGIATDRASAIYDHNKRYLRYNVTINGISAVVNEQPTPPNFLDSASNAYADFLKKLSEYDTFEVDAGVIHLTHPDQAGGHQIAVVNAKGTLIFVQTQRDLSKDQWLAYFKDFSALR